MALVGDVYIKNHFPRWPNDALSDLIQVTSTFRHFVLIGKKKRGPVLTYLATAAAIDIYEGTPP